MEKPARLSSVVEGLSFLLLVAALITMQVLIGGTRMVFSMPAYALLGLVGLLAVFSARRAKPVPSLVCLAVAAVFFAYVLGRALLSPFPYITRSDVHSVLGGLIVYFAVAGILTRGKQRIWLVVLLLIFSLGHVLIGAVQFRDGANFMPISWLQRFDYDWRASGFYICPNHLAGLLEVLGVMGLSIAIWSRWPIWGKLLIGYLASICYAGLALTGSRGGYLSAVASLFVFGVLSLAILRATGRELFWRVGGVGMAVALLLVVLAGYGFSRNAQLKYRAQITFDTGNMRVELWKSALQQWKLQPIVGTGSGTFLYYGRFFRTALVQRDPVYVHNDYLHLLAEYGLLGAMGMAAFLAVHLRHGLRSFTRLGPKRVAATQYLTSNALALNVGALAAVSSYLVHSIFDFNLHIPANVLLMAFVFALLANDGVVRDREPIDPPRGQILWRMALPALGLVLLVQGARIWPGEYFSERARMAVRDHQPGLGLLYARQGLAYDPDNPDLHYRLGMSRMQFAQGSDDPQAIASFQSAGILALERARALAPREQIYGLELASALDAARRFDEAEAIFDDLIKNDPKSESLRLYHEGHLASWRKEAPPPASVPAVDS